MGSRMLKAMQEVGNHETGNLNSIKVETVTHGALLTEDVDNFTVVELGFNEEGERTARQLRDVATKSYLIATPEERYVGESILDFFNAAGERGRIVVFKPNYTRFDTSAFSKNDGVDTIKNGQVAHFDPATKKFIISAANAPHADYERAYAKFLVVNKEDDFQYTLGKAMVRLEVAEA